MPDWSPRREEVTATPDWSPRRRQSWSAAPREASARARVHAKGLQRKPNARARSGPTTADADKHRYISPRVFLAGDLTELNE